MDYIEAEGNSIDEAIERALERLGVPREKAEIEILSNATRGLFGLGGRRAKVRAMLRTAVAVEPAPAAGRPVSAPAELARPKPPSEPTPPPAPPEAAATDSASLDHARTVLQELVRLMGSDARVEVAGDADGPRLTILGDASGVLIGRRGQTLDALEYLVNRVAAREEDHPGRIMVDSQNYRDRRRQALEDLARRLADRARSRGKPVTLNPMSPRDRRIVHLTLQNDRSLVTRSSGKGYFRRLVIIPEGERAEPRSNRRPRRPGPAEEGE